MIIFKRLLAPASFYKHALTIAVPLMLQQLVTSSVNLIDNLMIGQLGDAALGAVATTNRFFMIGMFATFGVLAASAIFIAQYYGAKDEDNMKQSFRFSILSAVVIMMPFLFFALLFPNLVLGFFTQDTNILANGMIYIRVVAFALIPTALTLAFVSAMRAVGETKIPLYVGIIAVLINAFLNYVLIFGHFGFPQLGILGAAIATLIARIIEAIILSVIMFKRAFPYTTTIPEMLIISKRNVKTITLKALPLAFNEFFWASGMATLFKFYATRGSEVISGISIASTTADLFFVLFGGMAVATTVLVSQPLGADNLEEAKLNGYRMISFSMMLAIVFGIMMFGASFIVPNFYNVSLEAKQIATNMIRIMSFMFWIYMGTAECYFVLRAGGDMKSTLMMDSGFMWLVNIPVVFLVTYFTGFSIYGLYLTGQSTDFVKLAVSLNLVKREKWVKNLTIAESTP